MTFHRSESKHSYQHRDPEPSPTRVLTHLWIPYAICMKTPPEPDAYERAALQRVDSRHGTLKYLTLTLTLTLTLEHPPQPRIELNACDYAHAPSI